ncbi:MAG: HAMP domain-containing histidine kinase [Oscillospiraceae bacterium]|nr:HAMP domain-containing histidine kinase [Oscillospiraceae bacterium]
MDGWYWVVIGLLAAAIVVMAAKIMLMKKSAGEIEEALAERANIETNTLITLSSRDKALCRLAEGINRDLRQLRQERQRFQTGDLELREAVTGIAHDLRTPLTAICGYLDLLEREALPAEAVRQLAVIRGRTEALRQMTEELFSYSAILSREDKPEPVNLCQALEEALLSFRGAFQQAGIQPEISLPERSVMRMLDKAALERAFGNILSNALRYSSGGLGVTMDKAGEITFFNPAESLTAVDAEKLWGRFYTVENGKGGTGLGMAIAKKLTERMGGKIKAQIRGRSLYITLFFPIT